MPLDLVIKAARVSGAEDRLVDIGIVGSKIAAIAPDLSAGHMIDAGGRLVIPGFVETHIHLDKSCVIDRCAIDEGTLAEAIRETARVKRDFTVVDIAARARRTFEKAILAGTMHMRTHVEVDPRIGLKGFEAVRAVANEYAFAIDVEICVFPQEGLLNDPGTEDLLIEACKAGAHVVGGCPYADTNPHDQIERIFTIAQQFDRDIDFHLDFDLDPTWTHLAEVCRQTKRFGMQRRVAIGHVTKLSAMPLPQFDAAARLLAEAGVAVTVLPATDLFLMGRGHEHNVPRGVTRADLLAKHGVTCSIATNNVLNAFTPYGDCSLCRMANMFANVAQLGRPSDLVRCMEMVTTEAAKLMNLRGYGIAVGHAADIVILDATSSAAAIAEVAQPLFGLKRGRRSFSRPAGEILRP